MGHFIGAIDLQVVSGEADGWIVAQDFTYTTDAGELITVTKGLHTDLASTPRIIWNIYPPFGLYTGAAVLHDCLYTRQNYERAKCDSIFLEAMAAEGVGWFSRHLIYRMVRLFGGNAWEGHTKDNYERRQSNGFRAEPNSHNRDQG